MTRIASVALLLSGLLLAAPPAARAQSAAQALRPSPLRSASPPPAADGLSVTAGGWGLAIGDVPRVNGLRINLEDERLEQVNGINLTFWRPDDEVGGEINGVALGLVSPQAGRIRGLSIGGGAVVGERVLSGIQLGGLAVVSEGSINGLSAGGLAVVGQRGMTGIHVGGLATVSEGAVKGMGIGGLALVGQGSIDGLGAGGLAVVSEGAVDGAVLGGLAVVAQGGLRGVAGSGLAVVSEGRMTGLSASGLATVAERGLRGVHAAGLALVSEGDVQGLSAAGLAVVSEGAVEGLAAGGLAVVAEDRIRGVTFSGYKIHARDVRWISTTGWLEARSHTGLSVAAYNDVSGRQRGLAIGVFNSAAELHGVQIGLLNHAGNNRAPFRWLPIFNAHF